MELEQLPPKQPNFLAVVLAFAGTILVIFVLALIFLHWDGKHLTFRHRQSNPTSLVQPGPIAGAKESASA